MQNRRRFLESTTLAAAASAVSCSSARLTAVEDSAADVMIYGATPAGIAAALAAASDGDRVVLADPTPRIGGMVTSGLSHTDFRTFEGLSGAYLDFSQRVLRHYASTYGEKSQQAADCFRGTQAEPKVNLSVFEQMLAERNKIDVQRSLRLDGVKMEGDGAGRRIAAVSLAGATARTITARVFIDASYEGDLMAAAGVAWRVGREGRNEYGESLAPENADGQLQAYNFRFAATKDPANRVTPVKPPGYRREDYVGVLPLLADGRIQRIFDYPSGCIFKAQVPVLPNGKYDINDVSRSAVRLSLPGENTGWPEGGHAERQRIFDAHMRWNTGLLWFLQNDGAVPDKFRAEAREWGWCRDEFAETGHLPPQLYVREARRMTGMHIYTENDTVHAEGDARAILHPSAIAVGDYGHNCHGTSHEGTRFGGKHTGEFYKSVVPYQIPYGTLLPRDVTNLLVPVAASSSHVGFCALRLEPIWMAMGQAAGHAAHQVAEARSTVQRVSVPKLQERLWSAKAATIYVSDVRPGDADFEAVQWWGSLGGLHGLAPMPARPGQRGENLSGQYYYAYPDHEAGLGRELNGATRTRWMALGAKMGIGEVKGETRGEWIRAARAAYLAL
ncbi:MAG: FAD-dependent oxidoreductase [Bryobacteraceae bacterium]